ncbi:bifunctional diguanylate cyclase/phosphodiesterase [Muricoccus pecuniae]|uniref:Diguanylate cyclase (GGDEF)-like protein n=1 Tax=Muricoccus pecuniae TaxID=693023 RepID=A0A840YER7_9PROT|nr:EAL domain-containing protein [Roseomonas pecuniae]MBB5694701.1 diguanylate cyclase (GGDEF)-like protein [Roseomonas pecuniae]
MPKLVPGLAPSVAARPASSQAPRARGASYKVGRVPFLAALLLSLAVVLASALVSWKTYERAIADAGRELRTMSVVLADHTDRAFQTVDFALAAVLERARAEGALEAPELFAGWASRLSVHESLRERSDAMPQSDALLLIGADGKLLSFSRSWPAPPNDLADREYFRLVRDGGREHAIGPPVHNRGTGTWSIHLAKRISGPDGEFFGAAVGVIQLAYFEHFYKELALGPQTSITLFRTDGTLIARHPNAGGSVGRDFGRSPQFRAAVAAPSGTAVRVESAVDGRERLVSARALAAHPLRVHVGTTVDAALADWREQGINLLVGCGLLLLLIGTTLAAAARKGHAEEIALAERMRRESELAAQDAKFRVAVQGMSQGLWKFSAEGRLELANHNCVRIIGYPRGAIRIGATFDELRQAAGSAQPLLDHLASFVKTGQAGSFVQDLENGCAASVVYQPSPDGSWVVTFEDVTERRAAEARVEHMARHDALTGLPNRVTLHERLAQAVANAGPRGVRTAVLYMDLDRFKEVNDTLGHPVGDALLKAASARILSNVRIPRGDLVARLGGDEFAVLVAPDEDDGRDTATEAAALARRLISILSEPFEIDGHQVVVGSSIGVAVLPEDGTTPDELLKNADLALYRAKQDGRGRVRFFKREMGRQAQERRQLELDLRRAVLFAPQEFEVHYQPVIDVATRSPTGLEALLRWHHPERGLVSPADFIPVAEEIGLIVGLGELVLRRACADATRWSPTLRVAVNLSPAQFRDPRLVETVAEALSDSGLPPGRLELEITEGVLLRRTEATMTTLHRLKSLGVRIALDDFGTGYSSLSYLRSFPFDKVKIDRAFVRDIETSSDDAAIVRAVTGLCERLGMTSTAEGVETEEQFRLVEAERCTEAQGYLFSRPVPASEVPEVLALVTASASPSRIDRCA